MMPMNAPQPGGMPEQGGQPNPEMIKRKLIELIQQAKQVAEQNGIDFNEILSAVSGGKPTLPPPSRL